MVQAKPALVEASVLKPRCCNALALPTSKGLGMMKQPVSWSFLKAARLSAVVSMISPHVICLRAEDRDAAPPSPAASGHDLAQEGALLREDELVLLGEIKIRRALAVRPKPCAVAFIRREAVE